MNEKELLRLIGQVSPELIERTLPDTEDITAAPEEREHITMTTNTEQKSRAGLWLRGGIAAAIAGVLLLGNIALLSGLGKIGRGGSSAVTPAATDTTALTKTTAGTETTADSQNELLKKIPDCVGMSAADARLRIAEAVFVGEDVRLDCRYIPSDQPADTVLEQQVSSREKNHYNGGRFAPALCVLTLSGGSDCRTVPVTVELPEEALSGGDAELILLDRDSGILFDAMIDAAAWPDRHCTVEVTGWGKKELEASVYTDVNLRTDCGTYTVDFASGDVGTVRETDGEGFRLSVFDASPDSLTLKVTNISDEPLQLRNTQWYVLKDGEQLPDADGFQSSVSSTETMAPGETRLFTYFWELRYGALASGSYVLQYNDYQLNFMIA